MTPVSWALLIVLIAAVIAWQLAERSVRDGDAVIVDILLELDGFGDCDYCELEAALDECNVDLLNSEYNLNAANRIIRDLARTVESLYDDDRKEFNNAKALLANIVEAIEKNDGETLDKDMKASREFLKIVEVDAVA